MIRGHTCWRRDDRSENQDRLLFFFFFINDFFLPSNFLYFIFLSRPLPQTTDPVTTRDVAKMQIPCIVRTRYLYNIIIYYNRSTAAAFRSRENTVSECDLNYAHDGAKTYYIGHVQLLTALRQRRRQKSFGLNRKRHFWPVSRSRANPPPKTILSVLTCALYNLISLYLSLIAWSTNPP